MVDGRMTTPALRRATDAAIAALDAVTLDDVRTVAAGISTDYSVACVGPHTTAEFKTT